MLFQRLRAVHALLTARTYSTVFSVPRNLPTIGPSPCISIVSEDPHRPGCKGTAADVWSTYLEVYFDNVLESFQKLRLAVSLRKTEKCYLWEQQPLLRIGLDIFCQHREVTPLQSRPFILAVLPQMLNDSGSPHVKYARMRRVLRTYI
jgi:hypothetical protein